MARERYARQARMQARDSVALRACVCLVVRHAPHTPSSLSLCTAPYRGLGKRRQLRGHCGLGLADASCCRQQTAGSAVGVTMAAALSTNLTNIRLERFDPITTCSLVTTSWCNMHNRSFFDFPDIDSFIICQCYVS